MPDTSFIAGKFLSEFLSKGLWVSLCAAALVFETSLLLPARLDIFLYLFVFFATVCSYNFHYLLADHFSSSSVKNSSSFIFFVIAGAAGAAVSFFYSGIHFPDAAIASLLTFLYSLPLLPFKQLAFARRAGFLKTLLLASTWTFVTAYIPWHMMHAGFTAATACLFARRFLFMLLLCIFFDNRDAAADKVKGLHSLATDLHPSVLKNLVAIVFMLLFLAGFIYQQYGITGKQLLALQFSALATLTVYSLSLKKRGYIFYYFLVDGLMMLSALFTGLASI